MSKIRTRIGQTERFATLDRASDSPAIWQDAPRSLSGSPRLTPTEAFLFEDDVRDIAGVDPSAWRDDSPEVHAEREPKLITVDLASGLDGLRGAPTSRKAESKERLVRPLEVDTAAAPGAAPYPSVHLMAYPRTEYHWFESSRAHFALRRFSCRIWLGTWFHGHPRSGRRASTKVSRNRRKAHFDPFLPLESPGGATPRDRIREEKHISPGAARRRSGFSSIGYSLQRIGPLPWPTRNTVSSPYSVRVSLQRGRSRARIPGGEMIYVTEVHMSVGGSGHEHIADVRWRDPADDKTGESSRAKMVEFIEGGGAVRVRDAFGDDVAVGVVKATPPYLRTHADGVWTDNLLSLPRY